MRAAKGIRRVMPSVTLEVCPTPEKWANPDGLRLGFTASKKIGKAVERNRARRRKAMPLMRCGFVKRGTMPAFTRDDLPEPLAPDTNRKARPERALIASCSVAFITAPSRPKKIGACSNS